MKKIKSFDDYYKEFNTKKYNDNYYHVLLKHKRRAEAELYKEEHMNISPSLSILLAIFGVIFSNTINSTNTWDALFYAFTYIAIGLAMILCIFGIDKSRKKTADIKNKIFAIEQLIEEHYGN
ncbi:MAG: hypothetical protein IJD45_01770 [Clostridia bacterium]|nr:hypothetical protein [Clostridia bacterium]